jgi:hypothetical protein
MVEPRIIVSPISTTSAPMYIGFRTVRYKPLLTSTLGGSSGAGIPLPTDPRLQAYQNRITTPTETGRIPIKPMLPKGSVNPSPDDTKRYDMPPRKIMATEMTMINDLSIMMI